jgi:hypothetical protein
MGIARRFVLVLCLIGVVCDAPGSAAANSRAVRRPAVLHPRFRLVADDVLSVAASDRYLVFTTPGFFGALIDRRTGARRAIEPPDCPGGAPIAFGGPWVAFSCPPFPSAANAYSYAPRVALYDLARQRWTTRDIAPGSGICDAEGHVQAQCLVGAVGSRWLEFYATQMCEPPDYQCGPLISGSFLANLDTGAVRRDPAMAAGRVIADLDNRSGAQRLCAPLRVPLGYRRKDSGPTGPVTFYGKFAVATGLRPDGLPFAILEHCASKLQTTLPLYVRQSGKIVGAGYWQASSRAVIWQTDPSRVNGILLPELRRFTINLTASQVRAHAYVSALTEHTIYIIGRGTSSTGAPLWDAPLPPPT